MLKMHLFQLNINYVMNMYLKGTVSTISSDPPLKLQEPINDGEIIS